MTSLACAAGAAKMSTFLDAVRTDQMAFNWELNVTVGNQPTILQFTGGRASDGNLFVIGATTREGVNHFYDELLERRQ